MFMWGNNEKPSQSGGLTYQLESLIGFALWRTSNTRMQIAYFINQTTGNHSMCVHQRKGYLVGLVWQWSGDPLQREAGRQSRGCNNPLLSYQALIQAELLLTMILYQISSSKCNYREEQNHPAAVASNHVFTQSVNNEFQFISDMGYLSQAILLMCLHQAYLMLSKIVTIISFPDVIRSPSLWTSQKLGIKN